MSVERKATALLLLLLLVISGALSSVDLNGSKGEHDGPAQEVAVSSHLMTREEMEAEKARVGVFDPSVDYTATLSDNAAGAAPPTEEQWEAMVGTQVVVDSVTAAAGTSGPVDLSASPYFPQVGNQGEVGSCAAWAETYYALGYLEAKDNGWTDASTGNPAHLLSPMWTYNLQNRGTDGGSYIGDNARVARDIGAATLTLAPLTEDVTTWGTAAAWREAPLHRAASFNIIPYDKDDPQATIDAIRTLLASGLPVVFGLHANVFGNSNYADPSGNRNNIISSSEYSSSTFNHANTIVGFDDSQGDGGESGSFKAVNSWGSDFANGGYYYITYKAFLEMAAVSTVGYVTDKEDYQPSLLAVWHFDDDTPVRDTNITISAVDASGTVLSRRSPFIDAGRNYFMPTFMCLDITELENHLTGAAGEIELNIGQSSYWGKQYPGTLSSFKVERYQGSYVPGKASEISPQSPELQETQRTPVTASNALPAYTGISIDRALGVGVGRAWSYGTAAWVSQLDGGDHVLQSGDVGDRDRSVVRVNITTSSNLISFNWKVSSEATYDYLRFYANGVQVAEIEGSTEWQSYNYWMSGSGYIEWAYEKDDLVSDGEDCGWIDDLVIVADQNPDAEAPSTEASVSGTLGQNGWYTSAAQVTLSATDEGWGVQKTYYRVDGGAWSTYASPFSVSSEGAHTLNYYSMDMAGNQEQTGSLSVKVDRAGPTTTSSIQGDAASPGWYNATVGVTLSSRDTGSGVGVTKYRVDGDAWLDYKTRISISAEGTHKVEYYAVDNAGNSERAGSAQFTIDASPPVTTLDAQGTAGGDGWYTSAVTVNLTAADPGGQARWTKYRLNDGEWSYYDSGLVLSGEGEHRLEYFSMDAAGNIEAARNFTCKIDTQGPIIMPAVPNDTKYNVSSPVISWSSEDGLSGINRTLVSINGGEFIIAGPTSMGLPELADGEHTLTIKVVDNAGNAAVSEVRFTVDTKPASTGLPMDLLLAVLAAAAVVAALGGSLIVRRRKG